MVMPKVSIPSALRQYAGNQEAILVSGTRVSEVLADLSSQYPELKKHLFDTENRLRSFVNIYVNDEDIRYGREVDPSLAETDELSIIPSIAGGIATENEVSKADLPSLTNDEVARYSRHLIMPEVGIEGQRKLKAASVLANWCRRAGLTSRSLSVSSWNRKAGSG